MCCSPTTVVAVLVPLYGRGQSRGPRVLNSRRDDPNEGERADTEQAESIDIHGFRRGDPESCRRVLEEHSPLIWSVVASYVKDPAEREDLYQEICVRIWEKRTLYAGRGTLAGWINRAAHRWCQNWRRSHRRRESSKASYASEAMSSAFSTSVIDDPAQMLDRKEFMKRLRESLAKLPPKQAETFVLVHLDGYSTAEAAETLDVRPATVRSNLRHATRRLGKWLKEFEYGLS